MKDHKQDEQQLLRIYKEVQFSVHNAGLFGELGPAKVSPQLIPLHVLICSYSQDQCHYNLV